MMEREQTRDDEDAGDVADNPEWSEEDIRADKHLSEFAPELAANIARTLRRPMRPPARRPVRAPTGKIERD